MNFSFGSNTPKTTAAAAPAGLGTLGTSGGGLLSSTTSTTGFQLSGAGDSKPASTTPMAAVKPAATVPLSFAPATSAPSLGFTGFGATPQATTASAAAPPTSAPNFSFGASATTTSAAPLSLTPSTTTAKPATTAPTLGLGATVTAPSSGSTSVTPSIPTSASGASSAGNITFVQLEETINKWAHELDEQEKIFMGQAAQINNWDNLLNSNSEKIVALNNEVAAMKLQQQHLDHELDFILAQQRELEEVLAPLEKQTAEVPSNTDPEREHTYYMAETLDTQLKQMSEDLREIIEHLNESSRTQDTSDPIVQIGRILNAHMNSLHWIDQMTMNIQNQLENVTRLHDAHRRENERSFRISYE